MNIRISVHWGDLIVRRTRDSHRFTLHMQPNAALCLLPAVRGTPARSQQQIVINLIKNLAWWNYVADRRRSHVVRMATRYGTKLPCNFRQTNALRRADWDKTECRASKTEKTPTLIVLRGKLFTQTTPASCPNKCWLEVNSAISH